MSRNEISFTPVNRPDLPRLYVGPIGPVDDGQYIFQGIDVHGEAQFETYHKKFSDALRQVALRMDADRNVDYEIEGGA